MLRKLLLRRRGRIARGEQGKSGQYKEGRHSRVAKYVHLMREFWQQGRRPFVSSVVAFVLPATLLVYYGLRGGSYDIVPRQEEALAIWWILGLSFAFGLL